MILSFNVVDILLLVVWVFGVQKGLLSFLFLSDYLESSCDDRISAFHIDMGHIRPQGPKTHAASFR